MSGHTTSMISISRNQTSGVFCSIGQHDIEENIIGHPCNYRKIKMRNGGVKWIEKRANQIYHVFCEKCIENYLLRAKDPKCPLCNTPIIKYKNIALLPFTPVVLFERSINQPRKLMPININQNLLFGLHDITGPHETIENQYFYESESDDPDNELSVEITNELVLVEEFGFPMGTILASEMQNDIRRGRFDGIINDSRQLNWQRVHQRKSALEMKYLFVSIIVMGVFFSIMYGRG